MAVALGATPLLKSQLYGLAPHDPGTLIVAIAVLLAAAFLACVIPASRASRIDPMFALKME
jgi:ABC-type lipoprotein release transport system permease subunit